MIRTDAFSPKVANSTYHDYRRKFRRTQIRSSSIDMFENSSSARNAKIHQISKSLNQASLDALAFHNGMLSQYKGIYDKLSTYTPEYLPNRTYTSIDFDDKNARCYYKQNVLEKRHIEPEIQFLPDMYLIKNGMQGTVDLYNFKEGFVLQDFRQNSDGTIKAKTLNSYFPIRDKSSQFNFLKAFSKQISAENITISPDGKNLSADKIAFFDTDKNKEPYAINLLQNAAIRLTPNGNYTISAKYYSKKDLFEIKDSVSEYYSNYNEYGFNGKKEASTSTYKAELKDENQGTLKYDCAYKKFMNLYGE